MTVQLSLGDVNPITMVFSFFPLEQEKGEQNTGMNVADMFKKHGTPSPY